MPHIMTPLPYARDALEPYLSEKTLSFHHDKHHQTYLDNLNKLVVGTGFDNMSLVDTISKSAELGEVAIFNNAAQVWNHTFYWNCMKPQGGGEIPSKLLALIERDLGGYQKFKDDFKQAALSQFGSGWAWLVMQGEVLKITKTANADTPLIHGQRALLTCDVWEHAYYIDYQNRRTDYVEIFFKHLVNWDFVSSCLV